MASPANKYLDGWRASLFAQRGSRLGLLSGLPLANLALLITFFVSTEDAGCDLNQELR